MKNPKIVVHCLVKNEENFIWYAINSILPYVDKIMVWDNGSTDKTVEIIKTIKSAKIDLESHSAVSREDISHLRQEMLERTPKEYGWLFILDGDEIWPENSLLKVIEFINQHPSTETIVTKTFNLVGDIYHCLPNSFGKYTFLDKKGNYSLRFINLQAIPGLHVSSPYGSEGYYDEKNLPVQNRLGVVYVDTGYFHATHLIRSSKNKEVIDRTHKLKYYLGEKISSSDMPKIFFFKKSSIIPDVAQHMNLTVILKSIIASHLRNIKNYFID